MGQVTAAAAHAPVGLRDIKDPRIRNLVRGALSPGSDRALQRTMQRLRSECSPADAAAAFRCLFESPLGHGLLKPEGFPEHLANIDALPLYGPARLQIELTSQTVRLERDAGRVIGAIQAVGDLNRAILAGDRAATTEAFAAYKAGFGISLLVGLKAISINHTVAAAMATRKEHSDVILPFLKPRRQVVAVSFEDSVDRERDYLKMRRSFLGFAREGRLGQGDAAIIIDQLSPLEEFGFDLGQRLQAYARWSLLDVTAYLHRLPRLLERAGRAAEVSIVKGSIPPAIRTAWAETFGEIDLDSLGTVIGFKEHYSDLEIFGHLPAWSEYPNVLEHRLRVEQAVGPRLDGRFPTPRTDAASFSAPRASIEELLAQDASTPSLGDIDPKTCGAFHRTIALVASIENGGVGPVEGEGLCQLLDQTINVPYLLSRSELNAFLPRRPTDLLYEYLRNALLDDHQSSKVTNHALRRVLQELIARRFNGDVVELLKHVDSPNGHVSTHLYYTCTEPFLTELYDLYKEADQVTEAQASILEWRGATSDDEGAIVRAKSHRLNLRLRKVRGAIEETRIYVDPLRFVEWIQAELGADFRILTTQLDDILSDADTSVSLRDPVRTMVVPRLKLLKLLDKCYAEFCTNKIYGVTSFIGRRIRHGTLHGHLVLEFRPEVEKAIADFQYSAPRFAQNLEDWHRRFEAAVLLMATEQIHVRSKDKPKGVIVATLDETDKASIAALMLREVAASMQESSQLLKSVALIRDYCWFLFAIDAKRAQQAVEDLRREFVLSVDQQSYADQPELQRQVHERVRALNSAMAQRFEVVRSWFTKPTNVSPSASVTLLFEAVLDEVRQRHPGFAPDPTVTVPEDVDLMGHRFHFFYDALYILVHNAARHGKCDGPLNISTELTTDDRHTFLTVAIASVLDPSKIAESRAGIEEAMTGEIGDAMVNHGRSGIRKLRGLVDSVEEIDSFHCRYEGDTVVFTIEMRYPR